MLSWEQTLARVLSFLRLDEIKRKILVFALVATLIPSFTMAWLSYVQNSTLITEKVSEELQVASSQTASELDIWIRERAYELRVFSSSYEVSENLQKSTGQRASDVALKRLKAYLESVSKKFSDHEELMVTDPEGRVVTTSAAKAGAVQLPANWKPQARAGDLIMGQPYWDDLSSQPVVTMAVPIRAADDELLGLLGAKLNFRAVESMMQRMLHRDTGKMFLIDPKGGIITSSQGVLPELKNARLPEAVMHAVTEQDNPILEYSNLHNESVLGSIALSSQQAWSILAELSEAEAYAQTIRIRNVTFLITSAVLLVIGMGAYLLGVTIVRPLNRLIKGASQVSEGNLSVQVPLVGGGEVQYLTEVFNSMVRKLHRNQEELANVNNTLTETNKELQELSTTDALTGLFNRRYLMDMLAKELERAVRTKHPLSVLMLDIDHFKKYNDTYGHLAGDDLLIKVGALFKKWLRSVDFCARYGGEEFLIILPEQSADNALEVAERVREEFPSATSDANNSNEPVTVSIGVASFPDNGATVADLIASADRALYQAKERGRNMVILSDAKATEGGTKIRPARAKRARRS